MVAVIPESSRRPPWLFALGVAGIAVGMYMVLVVIPFHLFSARLHVVDVAMPDVEIRPGVPFRIGLDVANERWGEGAAYVVFLVEGETEIEGAITRIPGREARLVGVDVRLDTGIREASLILYDARHGNQRIASRHGVHIVAGSHAIRLVDVKFPASVVRGETMTITAVCVVEESGPCEILPIAIVYDGDGRNGVETDGPEVMVVRGPRDLQLAVATGDLAPGLHRLTFGLFDPSEMSWVDRKFTRREFTVLAP